MAKDGNCLEIGHFLRAKSDHNRVGESVSRLDYF